MKKILFLLLILISIKGFSQDTPSGKPSFKVFWNFKNDFTKDESKNAAFELKRVYLGYSYKFDDKISGKITYDIGSNSSGSAYTAYVKVAQLDWKVSSKIKFSLGLIGNKQFKGQENLWGYRYVYKSFQDEYKFGASADLGFNSEFKLNSKLTMNVFFLNGEGYKNVQDNDGNIRQGISFFYDLPKGFETRIYFDSHDAKDASAITNSSFFLGYKADGGRLGLEYNKLNNARNYKSSQDGYNRDGFSIYGSKKLPKNYELFVRYDQISSNILSGESNAWNYNNDGSLLMFGTQYQATKGVKFNINYRLFTHDNSIINNKSILSLNAEFKI